MKRLKWSRMAFGKLMISNFCVAVFPASHFSHLSSLLSCWKNLSRLRPTVQSTPSASSPTSTDRCRYISSFEREYPHESHLRQTRTLRRKKSSVGRRGGDGFATAGHAGSRDWGDDDGGVPFDGDWASRFPSAASCLFFLVGVPLGPSRGLFSFWHSSPSGLTTSSTLSLLLPLVSQPTPPPSSLPLSLGTASSSSWRKSMRSAKNSCASRCRYPANLSVITSIWRLRATGSAALDL
mmetsp:Transcript_11309/g.26445  ORF Transcript_11309/g.26445 Transcript_11309/m.26445 type:complete len:237 (-) Transcript_11309:870-1580(-)